MMKRLLYGIIFILTIVSVSSAEDYGNRGVDSQYFQLYSSTVNITMYNTTGHGACTGVVIKNNGYSTKILTARHCVDGFKEWRIDDLITHTTKVDANNDLAIITFFSHIPNKTEMRLGTKLEIDDYVWHLGKIKTSNIYSKGQVFLFGEVNYADFYAEPGCSGGGVINENNELVGIVVMVRGLYNDWNLSIFEPIDDIKAFLDECGISY